MLCKRCPHLVRHGQLGPDKKTIEFKEMCGLIMKAQSQPEGPDVNKKIPKKAPKKAPKKEEMPELRQCIHHPFPEVFDYIDCEIYQETFKSAARKNDVVPTKDFQYSDALSGSSITDMELL